MVDALHRTTAHFRCDPRKPGCGQIKLIHERIDEPDRVICADVVVDHIRQKKKLITVSALDMCHATSYPETHPAGIRFVEFSPGIAHLHSVRSV